MIDFKIGLFLVASLLLDAIKASGQKEKDTLNQVSIYLQLNDFESKLVDIALRNNPLNAAVRGEKQIAEEKVSEAKWSWLDYINLSGNLNEFNLNPKINENNSLHSNFYYPRYNIGLNLNLGSFVERPGKIKEARYEEEIAQNNIDQQNLKLMSEVQQRYIIYQHNKKIMEMQTRDYNNAITNYKKASADFDNGYSSLDELNRARENYNEAYLNKLEAEKDFYLSKVQLEELLTVKLEDIAH